ncbi:30S ribosome-binding factor RbfA [Cytophagaceae bacterium ABcell3]|nr:30S ribosome-binding factor RbfA [Cytophagaceae bacterium ABcell3]
MDSKRQQRFSKLIQKELSEIFQKDAKSMFKGAFITVTGVKISPDLGLASVYLSFLMEKDRQALLDHITSQTKQIRLLLGNRIGKQARIIPELRFHYDDSAEYAARMDELFSKIDIPPATEDDDDEKQKE